MSNLTDKFVLGITLFTQIIVSFLVDKKNKCLSLGVGGRGEGTNIVARKIFDSK